MRQDRGAGSFDSIVPTYDAWYQTPLGRLADRLEKEAVFSLLENRAGDLALDISCGTGSYALALGQRGLRVVGVDVSEPMLRVAQTKAKAAQVRLALMRAEADVLPFRAGIFDLVTVILGLEFMADPGKTLEEARRVLKPNGSLIVAVLNRTGLWTLWRRLKRLFVPSIWRSARFLSINELGALLEERGFTDLRWRAAVYFLPLVRRRGINWLERWEAVATRWMPGRATFVAVAARRS